jgi:hypothetical protein
MEMIIRSRKNSRMADCQNPPFFTAITNGKNISKIIFQMSVVRLSVSMSGWSLINNKKRRRNITV